MTTRGFFAAAVLTLALAAPAAAQDDNLQLFSSVQKQVLSYVFFSVFDNIETQIDDGVVTLTGKVTMPFKRSDIEKRVAGLPGVSRVNNKIEVLPASRFDDQLRVRIARAIYGNAMFQGYGSMVNPPIHIIVDRGHVTLEGVVNSEVDRALARSLAMGFDSFSVKSELKTEAEARAELEKI